jgi:2-polyprenyl-6-methoxyphenol hydroxylase-like FAD-dependent oxidoreductase
LDQAEVLIVGAGPSGLVLALWLARLGVKFRIIEKNSGPGQASRAIAVQARTLEFYRQLGFAGDVVNGGLKMERLHLRRGSREIAVLWLGDFGKNLTAFPFVLSYPQDVHENLLIEKLAAADIEVEWNTELLYFVDDGQRVRVTLRKQGVEEVSEAAYLCGCDGARSRVRQVLNLTFPGGTYKQRFFVADVEETGAPVKGDISICMGADEFCLVFPIRSVKQDRLIGIVPKEFAGRENITFDDIRSHVEKLAGVHVTTVNWFSTYHIHHRVAGHFRVGRVFVAGDAGHVHSPVGGQGMNTGIGDAVNLAWKLGAVIQSRADASILDTYETERVAFARSLVATTDRAFQAIVGHSLGSYMFRNVVFPILLPLALKFPSGRRAQFRLISQIRIDYRESALSEGIAGDVHGGDRLPWVGGTGRDNFEALNSIDWQLHVYGEVEPSLRETAARHEIPLHVFPWNAATGEAGLAKDTAYLLRPDGYIALAVPRQDANALERFITRFKIKPRLTNRSSN